MSDPITSFRKEFWFLSNFHPAPVAFEGVTYETVEHAFQAAKSIDPSVREQIRLCAKPGDAKRIGRQIMQRPGWYEMQERIMFNLVLQKFLQHETLRRKLIDTGDCEIIEGNTWGDVYWGAVAEGAVWKGKNKLGKILMRVRDIVSA